MKRIVTTLITAAILGLALAGPAAAVPSQGCDGLDTALDPMFGPGMVKLPGHFPKCE